MSPSSRRAWIEIAKAAAVFPELDVALLAEGVDRNINDDIDLVTSIRRPPRGGRG